MRRPQVLAFSALLLTYCGFLLALYLVPHRVSEFGRMSIHQYYAHIGQGLSLGCLDYTLTDCYSIGGSWSETTAHYDAWVLRSMRHQTPIWLTWMAVISWGVGRLANRRRASSN